MAAPDAYLPASAYANRGEPNEAGFSRFQDPESGRHYFALVDAAGKVLFRSQGYESASSRNGGMAAVVRNLDAWYEAFDVVPGQRLYVEPRARVHIW